MDVTPQKSVPPIPQRIARSFAHSFTFYVPTTVPEELGPNREALIFWITVAISFILNGLVILSFWLADKNEWLDRTNWGNFGSVRTQTRGDAGCEFSADDRTNYLAQPITALSNFAFTFTGLIIFQFGVLDMRVNGKEVRR
jgi:hypothetical protein